jgi:hypothetical protein
MKGRGLLLSLFLMAPLAASTFAADVAGKWRVTISTAEGTITGLASLKQSGEAVSGWVGPSENDPIPITGTFKKGKLLMKTSPQPGRTVAFDEVELSIDGDTMSGTIEQGSHGKGTIKFVRSKSRRPTRG